MKYIWSLALIGLIAEFTDWPDAVLDKSANAGQNIATVPSKRMFIHQTLRYSGERLERTKFFR